MPFFKKINYFSLLKTSFFVFTSAILFQSAAIELNPLNLNTEFQSKLSSNAFLKTTQYFARGLTFKVNEKWLEQDLINSFSQLNYRQRTEDQTLLAHDFAILTAQECSNQLNQSLPESSKCLIWRNTQGDTYSLILSKQENDDTKLISQIIQLDPFNQTTQASTDPVLMAQFRNNSPLKQTELKLANYPVSCLNAVIAIEDNDFLDHSGISYTGLLRAIVKNVITLRKAQGGSTITQQLVKNYFLTPEKTYIRKAKELYMALKLESQWSKDEILQTYLNVIYMGQSGAFQVHGFGAASQYYFNKPIDQLNIPECALLAAIINNPGLNNPWKKTEKSKNRRALVLTKMKSLNLITEKEFSEAINYPMPKENLQQAAETAPYYFEAVRQQATELKLPIEGTSFFTHLDLNHQQAAQQTLVDGLKKLIENKKTLKKQKEKGLELQGVILSADHQEGVITAFVGGQSFKHSQFNRALYSQRQIGSLIKPFIYLKAIDQLHLSPDSTLTDKEFEWLYDKKKWKPVNYDKKFRGDIPLFFALKESLNSPSAQLAQQIGLGQLIDIAQQMGLTSKMQEFPSLSLGSSQHTPLEVLQAYSSLAEFGNYQKLSFIDKAINDEGATLFTYKKAQQKIIEPSSVALTIGIMKETLRTGTAKAVLGSGYTKPAAGKTGTTSDGKDAWFAGFTPTTTSVIWLGYDQNQSSSLTGGGGAVPFWIEFMKKINQHDSDNDFAWPETVEYKSIYSEPDQKEIQLIFRK